MTHEDEWLVNLWLFAAIVIVALALVTSHPLAAGLAVWPLRWAVARIVAAARRPDSDDFGQER